MTGGGVTGGGEQGMAGIDQREQQVLAEVLQAIRSVRHG
jgi:hypothetical protein